jgi:protein SCO1/2
VPEQTAARSERFRQVRILLWALVGLAALGIVAMLVLKPRADASRSQAATSIQASFGGPFTLVGGDGKPFSSSALAGKPYAMFFGFTNCGDVCPTTLARLVKLRQQAGGPHSLNIVFVTVDPERDGPKEVGQYATLFNSPIIGLTGSAAQIAQVKKQYGIFSEKMPMEGGGHDMNHAGGHGEYNVNHTSTVLLFGRDVRLVATIANDEGDNSALDKMKRVIA